MFLLVFKGGNEYRPVNLDRISESLENEGLTVDKVIKGNETRLIKLDLDSRRTQAKNITNADFIEKIIENAREKESELESEDLPQNSSVKVRRKRKLKFGKKKSKGGRGGRCCRCKDPQQSQFINPRCSL